MNRSRLISSLSCIALCLLGGVTVYVFHVRLSSSVKQPSAVPAVAQAKNEKLVCVETLQERTEKEIKQSQVELVNARDAAEKNRPRAKRECNLWAKDAVLTGRNLARVSKTDAAVDAEPSVAIVRLVISNAVETAPNCNLPTEIAAVAKEERKQQDAPAADADRAGKLLSDHRNVSVAMKRGNVAQFLSRSLCGALELNDAQWRQVDRTLAAYHQEGCARKLNRAARPQTELDAWQQQRAELSRHAFTDINARLTPEQAAQFRKLYQREDWLWSMDANSERQNSGLITASVTAVPAENTFRVPMQSLQERL